MTSRNKTGALALALALFFAPFTPAMPLLDWTQARQQDPDVPSDAEQSMFSKGQNLYMQGRYDQAVGVLKDFLKSYPNSIITDLTLLWLGRSYMQLGKLSDAEQIGRRLRGIKDTPFADIYEGELQTARRDNPSRASTSVAAVTPESKSSPTPVVVKPPVVKPPQVATASPTPRVSQSPATLVVNRPSPTPNTNTKSSTASTTTTAAAATPSPTPVLIAAFPPQPTTAEIETAQPGGTRPRRRGRARQKTIEPPALQAVTNTNTSASSSTTQSTQRVMSTPSPTPPVRTPELASNAPMTTGITTPVETAPSQGTGLNFTVKQVPNLILALRRTTEAASPGQVVKIPLTITNTGNKTDTFRITTDLPAEFQPTFSLAQGGLDTGSVALVTPQLPTNATVEVLLNLRVPETAIDGQQRRFLVNATSQAEYQVLRAAEGSINVVAPALTAAAAVSQPSVMPGETFTQTIAVRNSGSTSARSARADFIFNPQFELVSASPSPLLYDRPSRTAVWSLGDMGARDSRDIKVTLRAIPEALATTSTSLGRGSLQTQSLPVGTNFDSPIIGIGKVPRARIDSVSVGLTVTPGDAIYVPFVVRNPGNTPDSYELRITAPGAPQATIYADTNGDGQHQESEPAVTQTTTLAPQGGQFPMLLRVQIPSTTPDGQRYSYNIVARSLTSNRVASEASTVLAVATPRVRVRAEQLTDNPAPGDTIFYRLVLVNDGSGLAKSLVVTETLPDALQFVNSEPSLSPQDTPGALQRLVWRVAELAPGDTAVLRIAVRVRPNQPAGANLTSRHTLTYQDSNRNNYQGQ